MSTQAQRGRKVQRNNQKTRTLRIFYGVIGAMVIIGAAFLITFALRSNDETATVDPASVAAPNAPTGTTPEGFYYKGNPDAPVKVFEYSDFQCPACANFHNTLGQQIDTTYVETGQVQIIFHDFPLRNIHANAALAAEAARSAGEQGKFWEMHDLLFINQSEWSTSGNPTALFARYAEQLGLDRAEFERSLNDGTYTAQVEAAEQSAMQAGIPATPTFVINGQQVNAQQLIPAINAALANTQQ